MNGLTLAGVLLVLCPLSRAGWTAWLDRDNAGGNGDYELKSLFTAAQLSACGTANPTIIEARKRGTTNVFSATKYIVVGADYGLSCVNSQQLGQSSCLDYQVQYRSSSQVSSWLDRDNQSGNGDYELKSLVTASDGWVDGNVIAWRTNPVNSNNDGNVDRRITMGPGYGLSCVNAQNTDAGTCHDYEVRFFCP